MIRKALTQLKMAAQNPAQVRRVLASELKLRAGVEMLRSVEFAVTWICNLKCEFCYAEDLMYAQKRPPDIPVEVVRDVMKQARKLGMIHVNITGGEPMIAPGVEELTRRLREGGYHLTIETAATIWKDVVCDLASISPKLANSTPWERESGRFAEAHEKNRINFETIKRFMELGDYQLKFVVDQAQDLMEIDELLSQLGPVEPSNVLLMPQGITCDELASRGAWLADICKQRGFRFCPRLHIALYGNMRGT